MPREIICAKCGGLMDEGIVLDHSGQYNSPEKQVWSEGTTKKSVWSGMIPSDAERFYVQAFRCANCGYLEFYTTGRA